jgi:hypothetical protein
MGDGGGICLMGLMALKGAGSVIGRGSGGAVSICYIPFFLKFIRRSMKFVSFIFNSSLISVIFA